MPNQESDVDFWKDCPIISLEIEKKSEYPDWWSRTLDNVLNGDFDILDENQVTVELDEDFILTYIKTGDKLPLTTYQMSVGRPCMHP